MIAWYQTVFGATIVHEDKQLVFLTWDGESHRLALVKAPSFLRFAFPLAKLRRKFLGVDHLGLTFTSLERLLATYERLKKAGIVPVWSINHGPTTSLYYEDPDGIRLEFQTENFSTPQETAEFFFGRAFAQNPIGVIIDPDYLLERSRGGADRNELLRQGAGTRPGSKTRANKRALSWKAPLIGPLWGVSARGIVLERGGDLGCTQHVLEPRRSDSHDPSAARAPRDR